MAGRYGYWFPLALLGFGLLLMLAWEYVRTPVDFGWFAYGPVSSIAEAPGGVNTAAPLLAYSSVWNWTWTVLITVTLAGTMAWYAVRARRAGRSARRHVVVAVAGGVAVWACHFVAGFADASGDPGALISSVGLPLVALGALALAHLSRGRTMATISVCCLVAGAAVLLGTWSQELLDTAFLAGGLLALARFERSRLVAAVAGLVLVARLVFPFGTPSTLIPAIVVFAAAIVALVRRDSTTAPA